MRFVLALSLACAACSVWAADSGLSPTPGGSSAVTSVNTRTGGVTLVGTDIPAFVASGGSHAAGAVPDPGSSAGTTKYLCENGSFSVPPGTGSGSVTSVAMTVPSIMAISGSPITSRTLALTLGTEAANTVFAGPTSGGATTPTFRALVTADLPTSSDFQFFRAGTSGAPSLSLYQRSDEIDIWDDFLGSVGGTQGLWAVSAVGGTLTPNGANATNLRPGELDFASGTGATDRVAYRGNVGFTVFGNGSYYFGTYMCVPTLSNSSQEYSLQIGFVDTVNAVDSVDGAYFAYDRATTSTDVWECVTSNNSTRTKTVSAQSIVAGTYYKLEVVMNAAGTSCAFKVNGSTIATNTTNIPTGTGRGSGPGYIMNKSVGTTATTGMRVDCVRIQSKLTTDNRNF